MIALEFWIATATDDDGDLHWSDILWGDGMDAAAASAEAYRLACNDGAARPFAQSLTVHGPYLTNAACTVAF